MNLPDQPKPPSPLKAIRAYCLSCCKGSQQEVRLCPATECVLHDFRMGRNPFRKSHPMSEEHKQKLMSAREKFNTSKTFSNESDSETDDLSNAISHLDMSYEESYLNRNEFPTYPNFPEEGDGSS